MKCPMCTFTDLWPTMQSVAGMPSGKFFSMDFLMHPVKGQTLSIGNYLSADIPWRELWKENTMNTMSFGADSRMQRASFRPTRNLMGYLSGGNLEMHLQRRSRCWKGGRLGGLSDGANGETSLDL